MGENCVGWHSIAYLFFALGIAALWLTVSAVYMTYIIIREGAHKGTKSAMAILASAAILAAIFCLWLGA